MSEGVIEKKTIIKLIITILFGWLGIHKFMDKQYGLGILYFFTLGLFGIGWIYDICVCVHYLYVSFKQVKNNIKENTQNYNELNDHMSEDKIEKQEKMELIITIVLGLFGVHKFIDKQYGLGLLYLFTLGLFGIGWIYDICACIYYSSDSFKLIKNSIKENTDKCNELNDHIEELKNSYVDIKRIDYGTANYYDNNNWNYKRPAFKKYQEAKNIYNCSRTVCSNARMQPFKYICKYFNIKATEENLEKFENVLNDFDAAEQGKSLLKNERDEIVNSVSNKIPIWIKLFNKNNMIKKLGFNSIDFSQLYFPRYTFNYISSGGNSSMQCSIIFDIENLNKFVEYLSSIIKFKKSAAGQRALMTSKLREKIKKRDNYTCCKCGNSIEKEPNLLLEIDHIIPISKNGLTTESNLQTLCWKCNRKKGSKLDNLKMD